MEQPDNTALRTALWRALHVQIDERPPIIEDEVGFHLISPNADWRERPDMKYTARLRAAIIARARFIEDLAKEQIENGVTQYVILGAGLDTFVQRNPELASHINVFEIDQAQTLAWKQKRLLETGYGIPGYLHFVNVDFELDSWWSKLQQAGFDTHQKTFIACTGVSLYLSRTAIMDTLKQIKVLAPGSTTLAMTFYLPIHLLEQEDQPMQEIADRGAKAADTPFVSFFTMDEVKAMAEEIGFQQLKIISTKDMEALYFLNRTDNLRPASGEFFLVATV